MGSSTNVFRVATGGQTNTIAPPRRNINVYAFHQDFGGPNGGVALCPYLDDESIEYPNGDRRGQAGWDVAIRFGSLAELADKLTKGVSLDPGTKRRFGRRYSAAIQRGEIARLAITAHGDQAGEWYANGKSQRPLTAEVNKLHTSRPVAACRASLHTIGLYTMPLKSTIILMGCLAGQGALGTALLSALSTIWPNRQVVGFDVLGYVDGGQMKLTGAGNPYSYAGMKLTWFRSGFDLLARHQSNIEEIGRRWDNLPWASEFSQEHAKIVENQKVIQCPSGEVCPVE